MALPLAAHERSVSIRAGVRVEVATVLWMAIEAVVAIGAGLLAHSVLLTAFGVDSVIELVTGGVLLWRLSTEAYGRSLEAVEQAETKAAWVTGVGLVLLCIYVLIVASYSLVTHVRAENSPIGVGLSVGAVVVMPVLAYRKRRIAAAIDSAALRGDAACSITCAYMAAAMLIGLLLNVILGWWWADSITALLLLYWLVPEAREALKGARAGRSACACGDDPKTS